MARQRSASLSIVSGVGGRIQSNETELRRQLHKRYDQLWTAAIHRIRHGKAEIDPVLATGLPDRRRGLTVIARPALAIRRAVTSFLRDLRKIEPDQYYYASSELHLTVLSLFSATADFRPFFAERKAYIAAVDAALHHRVPIHLSFEGITISPSCVMVQGFVETNDLNELRERLRAQLRRASLGGGLDERYKLETAHMTILRFRAPLLQPKQFAEALERARKRKFGATTIRRFTLVENDWYMSRRGTVAIKKY